LLALTHFATMRDPRTPEILAWLRRLPLPDRLATMYAMSAVYPAIKNDRSWKARIDAVVAQLKPTPQEYADILTEADRISRNLKSILQKQGPKQ
jgi:hypothetical protein